MPLTLPSSSTVKGVSLALAADTLTVDPMWYWLDTPGSGLVSQWSIDRGRSFELDRTDVGTAKVEIFDRDGTLDPTNSGTLYLGEIQPLIQAAIALYNPHDAVWVTVFRGYVNEWDYALDEAQNCMKLTLELVDALDIFDNTKMYADGTFGDDPNGARPPVPGSIYFVDRDVQDRISQVLTNMGWPSDLARIFTGNVVMQPSVYSSGDSVLSVCQDAADAEFPGVANFYIDKFGVASFHGRFARFTPLAVSTSTDWDFRHFKLGDKTAWTADTDTAPIRSYAFNRGAGVLRNYAYAAPQGIKTTDIAAQVKTDPTSIGLYGIRSWDAQGLWLQGSINPPNVDDPLSESQLYGEYIVENYATPRERLTSLVLGTVAPGHARAGKLWNFLCNVDISDMLDLTATHPGGGGFEARSFYVEGLHYVALPHGSSGSPYANVTLSVDTSPVDYYSAFDGNSYDPTTQ